MDKFELRAACIRPDELPATQGATECQDTASRAWYLQQHPQIIAAASRFSERDTVRVTAPGAFENKLGKVAQIGDSGVVIVLCESPLTPKAYEYGFHPCELEICPEA
jgi:hypothetical protein